MTEKTDRTISFEVKEHIGVVATYSSGWSKELNLIAWNGAAPKYDIRDWDETHTHMSKGVTLFEGEMQTLMDIYVQAKNRRIFEEAKKQREARAREIEEGRKAYAQRKAALDRAIAARDESANAGESLNKSEIEAAAALGINSAPVLEKPLKVLATMSQKAAITKSVKSQQNSKKSCLPVRPT